MSQTPRNAPSENARRLVLVAEDDPDVRAYVSVRLERDGYEVMGASDGQQALEMMLDRRPDLSLIDLTMPKMDGLDLIRRIRENDALNGMRVIVLSGSFSHIDSAMKAGANDYLTKPIGRPEHLLTRVRTALEPSS